MIFRNNVAATKAKSIDNCASGPGGEDIPVVSKWRPTIKQLEARDRLHEWKGFRDEEFIANVMVTLS